MCSEVNNIEEGIVHLPSRSILYRKEDGSLVFPEGIVRLRPMTTREEQILMSARSQASRDQIMYDLVGRCIINNGETKWNFDNFLVGDVLYMLMVLRSVTWGPEYMFETVCDSCSNKFVIEIKIPYDLRVFILGENFQEPFFVTLPRSKRNVALRLLRVSDEKAISEFARRNGLDSVQVFPYRLARHIISWDGVECSMEESYSKVLDLQALDSEAIRDRVSEEDCGIDLFLNKECPGCGTVNMVRMEFTTDFFRSKRSALRGRGRAFI